jgi:erythromycin esterase-like protein
MRRQIGTRFGAGAARLSEELAASGDGVATELQTADDLDPLLDYIGDARLVLLGEASHGTSDYYTWRMQISRRLIEEKGFSFIAVEGDWPDCYLVNRFVKGYENAGEESVDVLATFERWPTWMWANWEVAALADWMRRHNAQLPADQQAGFYGLDVYSLWESMTALMGYLEDNVPDALETARRAYLCFEPYGEDAQAYARSTALVPSGCEDEVVQLLSEVREQVQKYEDDPEAALNAEQNAWVTAEAEHYYRTMVQGGGASWNVRDYHMADTLTRLLDHHSAERGEPAKAIVWEHNTHIGDARYTDMASNGMVNVGQIARERYAAEGVVLVGFGSYQGSVIAGQEWGAPMARMRVPKGIEGSWESVLHEAFGGNRLLLMDRLEQVEGATEWRGHRAIGVVYHPDFERGNYVPTVLPQRYDAFLYLDQTSALHPLYIYPREEGPPETYPWGV